MSVSFFLLFFKSLHFVLFSCCIPLNFHFHFFLFSTTIFDVVRSFVRLFVFCSKIHSKSSVRLHTPVSAFSSFSGDAKNCFIFVILIRETCDLFYKHNKQMRITWLYSYPAWAFFSALMQVLRFSQFHSPVSAHIL